MSTGIQLPELQGFAGCRPNCNSDILFRRFTFLVSEPTSQSTNVFRIAGHLAWLHEQFFKSSPILTESENVPRWYAHPSSPFQCNFSCWFELNLEHCRPKLSSDLGNVCFSGPRAIQPPQATTAHLLSRRQAESSESLTKIRLPSGSHAIPLSTSGPLRRAAFASAAAAQEGCGMLFLFGSWMVLASSMLFKSLHLLSYFRAS
jgi:hypothetical protein